MTVLRLFSRGGQNFPKTYNLPLKIPKNITFSSKKVEKHTILAGQGGGQGQGPPLALSSRRPRRETERS